MALWFMVMMILRERLHYGQHHGKLVLRTIWLVERFPRRLRYGLLAFFFFSTLSMTGSCLEHFTRESLLVSTVFLDFLNKIAAFTTDSMLAACEVTPHPESQQICWSL
jgi:hypothetical protein